MRRRPVGPPARVAPVTFSAGSSVRAGARGRLRAAGAAAALLGAVLLAALPARAQREPAFDVVVLGATGGIQDGNLSAFLVRPAHEPRGVACDAGSLVNGIRVADERGAFADVVVPPGSRYSRIGHVLTDTIQGVLISHAHLDHVLGLVIASPDDVSKPVYALLADEAPQQAIRRELEAANDLGLRIVIPQQGDRYRF